MKTMEGLHLIDGRSCCLCQRRVRFICIFNVCFFFVSGVSASYGSDMFFSSMLAVWPLALACYERYIYIYIVCNMPLLKGCGAVCPLFVFRI